MSKETIPAQREVPADVAAVQYDLIRIVRTLRVRAGRDALASGAASALYTVVTNAPIRTTELADREGVTTPTMSRVVAALEKSGMVARTDDPTDGRVTLLVATADGEAYVHGKTSVKAQMLATALDSLDADQRVELTQSLGRLGDAVAAACDAAACEAAASDGVAPAEPGRRRTERPPGRRADE
ncbi:hypothetical protein GCM10023147_47170 [Tsukamurella soli]|uniref:HTH marR-type domain-containing protein n=1 Tax=Tsukamurella soli TaxID=644556 RepID=A0ABP8KEA7_9ACTN